MEALKEQARQALPQVEGTLRVKGLHGPVEVIPYKEVDLLRADLRKAAEPKK